MRSAQRRARSETLCAAIERDRADNEDDNGIVLPTTSRNSGMASFGLWWIEIVTAVAGLMCLAVIIREAAAFIRIRGIRRRDGGVSTPRTKEEYLLLFPHACPRCLSLDGRRVRGWHLDAHGGSRFVDTWQCGECAHVEGGDLLIPMPGADATRQSVRSRQRWFISRAEAERIERPRLPSR
jgi:hypothetical protein